MITSDRKEQAKTFSAKLSTRTLKRISLDTLSMVCIENMVAKEKSYLVESPIV